MMIEIKQTTRNGKVLFDFVSYCIQHPDERFWQALRNWSGYHFVEVTDDSVFAADRKYRDTFYLEEKRHDGN
jgi:hypothetical protein